MLWQDVPGDRYLDEALCLSADERTRLEIALARLPPIIIDTHTHVARAADIEHLNANFLSHTVSTFPVYTLAMAERAKRILWPGKIVRSARMAHAVAGYRHSAINDYISAQIPPGDLVIGFGVPAEASEACRRVSAGEFAALKMYFRSVEPPLRTVREVFPDTVLDAAQTAQIPIILHLPRSLPDGLSEVLDLVSRYPQLTVILAHLGGQGGQFLTDGVIHAFRALTDVPSVLMDTALVFDRNLVRTAIHILGASRILFGTDEPLSLIRATAYTHPTHGPRLFAPGYHWAQEDRAPNEVRERVPLLLHIQMIEALIAAVDADGPSLQAIFHDNANRLLGSP